jgi:hypothetical protein
MGLRIGLDPSQSMAIAPEAVGISIGLEASSRSWRLCLCDLHYVRAPEKPIQAHFEPVSDLADAIEIKGSQHSYGLKIESASGAHSDASVNSLRFHATNAAGFGETVAKNAEVGGHRA